MEKEILPLIYRPGHTFWSLHIAFKGMGSFFRLYSFLSKAELEVIDTHLSKHIEKGEVSFVVDATKSRVSINMLKEKLKAISGVVDVFAEEISIEGFGYHLIYPYKIGSHNIVISIDLLVSALLNSIKEEWGSAGEFAIFRIGKSVGKKIHDIIKSIYKVEGKQLLTIILMMHEISGWAKKIELLEYGEEGCIKIRIYENVECLHVNKNAPNCHFMRGVLTGICNRLFNKETEVLETKCLAKGDEYCQFEVKCKK